MGKINNRQFFKILGKSFGNSLGWYLTILPPILVFKLAWWLSKVLSLNQNLTIICSISVVQFIIFLICLKIEIGDYLDTERSNLQSKAKQLQLDKERKDKEHSSRMAELKAQEKLLYTLLHSKVPFKDSATMQANVESLIFKQSSDFLKYKRHPARAAAKEVENMRKIFYRTLQDSKEIQYKYEYILSAFPEIAEYVHRDEDLISIGEFYSYSEIDELRDRRKDYLSEDEYRNLTEDERSQLALDRYIANKNKSKWQIGRDYEMCCAFHLKHEGYRVEMHGIKYRKNDLGRDLIAKRLTGGLFGHEVLIVQCKNWSSEYVIHENVIMQLFGTAIEYQLSDQEFINKEVIPVLMIPTYSKISQKAIYFAKKLHVRIARVPFVDYPRIKCNINNGNKIYHLPFDQQYDKTEIKLKGECYVYTVNEAVSLGFRRAKRHFFDGG